MARTALIFLAAFAGVFAVVIQSSAAHDTFLYKWPWYATTTGPITTLPYQGVHACPASVDPPRSCTDAWDFDIVDGNVVAAAQGTVSQFRDTIEILTCNRVEGPGNFVKILDPNGLTATYAHLAQVFTYVDALQGDRVGTQGQTGCTLGNDPGINPDGTPRYDCGIHLHWEFTPSSEQSPTHPTSINGGTSIPAANLSTNDPIGGVSSAWGAAIRTEYRDEGSWATVGWVHDAGRTLPMHRYGAGWEQTFKKHPDGAGNEVGGIYAPDSLITDAFWVQPDFWTAWQANGGEANIGYPVGDKISPCPGVIVCQYYQQFERGFIWANSTPNVVRPALYTTTDSPAHRRWKLGDAAWAEITPAPPAGTNNRLRYFAGGLMFYNDANGSLRRSTDRGDTWAVLSPPATDYKIIDLDRCSSGRIWALWRNNVSFFDYFAYYSDNNGDSWTLSHTPTANRAARFIACHPTDSNKIAFTMSSSDSGTSLRLVKTTDGGSNWADGVAIPPTGSLQADPEGQLVWTSGGRVIVTFTRLNQTVITVSDDNGQMWTTKINEAENKSWGQIIRGSNGVLFAIKHTSASPNYWALYRSTDNDSNWDKIKPPNPGALDEVGEGNSLAYDVLQDVLYLGSKDEANVYKLPTASTIAASTAHNSWTALPNPTGELEQHQRIVLVND